MAPLNLYASTLIIDTEAVSVAINGQTRAIRFRLIAGGGSPLGRGRDYGFTLTQAAVILSEDHRLMVSDHGLEPALAALVCIEKAYLSFSLDAVGEAFDAMMARVNGPTRSRLRFNNTFIHLNRRIMDDQKALFPVLISYDAEGFATALSGHATAALLRRGWRFQRDADPLPSR